MMKSVLLNWPRQRMEVENLHFRGVYQWHIEIWGAGKVCVVIFLVWFLQIWPGADAQEMKSEPQFFLSQFDISNSYRVSHYLSATMLNEQQKGMLTDFYIWVLKQVRKNYGGRL
ncbi:hypothetical protein [Saezia sanguinis]|uniref:hypothetical protein n=1 Tax=Saezia sanguinis TaxID=1965230 RepID=UPI00305437A1